MKPPAPARLQQVHIPFGGGGYEPITSFDSHEGTYSQDHEAIQESLLRFCSDKSWNNSSRSAFMPRPILVSSEHQRQWKELNNALVSAITDIVERWWTDSVSKFPERMPLDPVEEDLLRALEEQGIADGSIGFIGATDPAEMIGGIMSLFDHNLPLHLLKGDEHGIDIHMVVELLRTRFGISSRFVLPNDLRLVPNPEDKDGYRLCCVVREGESQVANDLRHASHPSHITDVSNTLRQTGILKVSLQFEDDSSHYLQHLMVGLHKQHGHGLPITHSASRGWFWDIRPNSTSFQTPSHQARSETMEEFPWHTDCSYEEAPPRYFALQVLREDQCGGGTLSVMNVGRLSSLLSTSTCTALLRPEYRITVPLEFVKDDAKRHVVGGLMATDAKGLPSMVRFREDIVTPLTAEAALALQELKNCLLGQKVQAETLQLTSDCLPRGSGSGAPFAEGSLGCETFSYLIEG
ncbi:taurine catabolism dioxygenase TauD [Aspergillus luchuensis IFO 4308]|nr:taurine catabolism dioxygenase TauD [Aspergillus luchuensis IFO 4308]